MFNSVQHALSYAYRIHASEIVKVSRALADLRSSGLQLPREYGSMTPQEHHAEAATILRRVDALPAMQKSIIEAYYDRAQRWPAILMLADVLGYDELGRDPTREFIAAWFGEQQNQHDEPITTYAMAKRYGGSQSHYARERKRVFSQLAGVWNQAISALEWQLLEKIEKRA